MPQKLNKAGKMQDYIPKGNGDASGEYGTSNGTNKNFKEKKETKANVITENKSVVVENKGKKESLNKMYPNNPKSNVENGFRPDEWEEIYKFSKEINKKNDDLIDETYEIAEKYNLNNKDAIKKLKEKYSNNNKANIIDDDLTGKKSNFDKALEDLKQWETYANDDMEARTSKADARDKYIKNSDYVKEDTKLQNEYVFESMKGKDVNKIYDLIKETGIDPKTIYEKGKYPNTEFLVREKILKLIKDGKVKIDYSKGKIPTYRGRYGDVSDMVVGTLMENMRYELAYGNKFKNK